MELSTMAFLFGAGVVAAAFDAIAGGGGLLTVPALLLAGLDPVAAIATNKLQASASTISSTLAFARKGLLEWRVALPIALSAAAGSMIGAFSVRLVPTELLKTLVPLLLIATALYFLLVRKTNTEDARAHMSPFYFAGCIAPVIGFYDGVFGPGAGSFYTAAFVSLLGYGMLRATANTKISNAASCLGGLCLYAATGNVVWIAGLAMAAGSVLGAQIGAALAIRFGARLVRPLLVTISVIMAVHLLMTPSNPLMGHIKTFMHYFAVETT